jgi:phosphoenolpyruvate carboxykinase (ATP)
MEKFRRDKNFGFEIPMFVEGVNSELLDPRKTWKNPEKYDIQARKLIDMFIGNFEQYIDHVDDSIKAIVLR